MNAIPKMAACAKAQGRVCCGRRGLPAAAIAQMYADYQRLGSLEKVGALYDRSRQSIFDIFSRRGLKLNAKKFHPVIVHGGRKFTPGKNGYLRDTIFRKGRKTGEVQLHRVIWEQAHGPIPAGFKICFKDGDRHNCALANLVMLSHDEQQQVRGTGANQFTKLAKIRLATLLQAGGGLAANLRRAA